MSEIIKFNEYQVVTELNLSRNLTNEIERYGKPYEKFNPKPELIAEAKSLVPVIASYTRCISLAELKKWLSKINASVKNPQGEKEYIARCAAIYEVCESVPAVCFDKDALFQALSTFDFWPSGAEVYKIVSNRSFAISNQVRKINLIANAIYNPPEPELTQEQRAEMAEHFSARVRESNIGWKIKEAEQSMLKGVMREFEKKISDLSTEFAQYFNENRDENDPVVKDFRRRLHLPDNLSSAEYFEGKGIFLLSKAEHAAMVSKMMDDLGMSASCSVN